MITRMRSGGNCMQRITFLMPAFVTLIMCGACHHAAMPSLEQKISPPTFVQRVDQRRDSVQAARNVGSITVIARAAAAPTENLESYVVTRTDSIGKVLKDYVAKGDSAVTISDLPIGWHFITVKRLGYHLTRFKVHVDTGCRTDIEAYLTVAVVGIEAVTVRRDKNGMEKIVSVAPMELETAARSTITGCSR